MTWFSCRFKIDSVFVLVVYTILLLFCARAGNGRNCLEIGEGIKTDLALIISFALRQYAA